MRDPQHGQSGGGKMEFSRKAKQGSPRVQGEIHSSELSEKSHCLPLILIFSLW